ncbi:hypothetical protein CJ305_07800 [Leeuwenhoekiella nanhaiensis]|uniref:Thoeris protein ThsB TIR-like domain-containing protein n=1 Tax=Leeuwenhoekiella nanhaiensis TaxID=1655491 RepID=A0A2G1VTY1_9FLAO|nr:hypothetical protein CJ305_07800 [Leeuwenhoekiella nanhaiensis]
MFGEEPQRSRRIFISFAIEDSIYRDYLISQVKNKKSPFEFMDMSAKKPWRQSEWKKKCRTKIKRSDGVIVLLSKNTWHAGGARWEIKCAREEKKPIIGMHIRKNDKGAIPPELKGRRVVLWSWTNLEKFVSSIKI